MKNLHISLLSVFFLIFLSNASKAQVIITGASPTIAENTNYTSLSTALQL
jgi:hypothetical protein